MRGSAPKFLEKGLETAKLGGAFQSVFAPQPFLTECLFPVDCVMYSSVLVKLNGREDGFHRKNTFTVHLDQDTCVL